MARSILDELIEGFGRAVKDVREKVVEEPFYGRSLFRPGGGASHLGWTQPGADDAPARPSFEEQWAPRERGPDQPAPPGLDIER